MFSTSLFARAKDWVNDVEADETSFRKWKIKGQSQADTVTKWYPWLGVLERGSKPGPWGARKLWMRSMGVTRSTGSSRVRPA
jgi:hypothetical protein